jgi:predicted nucleic acid-binding Zn ribbon protein
VDKLGNLLPQVLARQPGRGRITELNIRLAFSKLMGPSLAEHCAEVEVRGSVLIVTTANPALAHQLRLDGETLLERLNEARLGRRLRSLRVRTGRAPGSASRDR